MPVHVIASAPATTEEILPTPSVKALKAKYRYWGQWKRPEHQVMWEMQRLLKPRTTRFAGFTMGKMARKAAIDTNSIMRIRNGSAASLSTVESLARIFGHRVGIIPLEPDMDN